MRIFMMLIILVISAIVMHNYFGGFTSRDNQDSAEHFSDAAQRNVSESVSEYEKKFQKSLEKAGAD